MISVGDRVVFVGDYRDKPENKLPRGTVSDTRSSVYSGGKLYCVAWDIPGAAPHICSVAELRAVTDRKSLSYTDFWRKHFFGDGYEDDVEKVKNILQP